MVIRQIENNEINREKWDGCVAGSDNSSPYGYTWYLDIISPEWEGVVAGDYEAVMPLSPGRKYGFTYLATPPFIQQLGPFSRNSAAAFAIGEHVAELSSRYRLTDICLAAPPGGDVKPGITIRKNQRLNLSGTYEKLREGYSSNCRRNIKLAAGENFILEEHYAARDLITLYRKNSGRKTRGVGKRDYDRLATLMNHAILNRRGHLYCVRRRDGEVIYGLFTIELPESVILLFTATTAESRERRTGYFVVDSLIKRYADSGRVLDFAGSSIPSIATYNRSFGASDINYYRFRVNNLPWPLKLLKKM